MGIKHHHVKEIARTHLKRSLGFLEVTLAGVGIILGAGIYALIGIASGYAGNAVWLSFAFAGLLSAFTGLSYAELSTFFRQDGAEYDYAKSAFGTKIAWIVGIMVIITGFVSAAAVSLGFGNYLQQLVGGKVIVLALLLVVATTIINMIGIKQSSFFNIICTVIESLGLIFIIVFGAKYLGKVNYLDMAQGMHGVFRAAALVFFAYMGFEAIVKLQEETKNPSKTIPRALIWSVVISAAIYITVALIAVSVIPWQQLSTLKAPLASVAAILVGSKAFAILAIVALFSTSNTVLVTLVTSSRLVYGMASKGSLPKWLARIEHRTQTPWNAILALAVLTALFVMLGDIEFVANLNDMFLFITFASVNLATIVLRYSMPNAKRAFKVPLNIGRFPLLSLFGVLVSLFMLFYAIGNVL